jgi:hypothetical protein
MFAFTVGLWLVTLMICSIVLWRVMQQKIHISCSLVIMILAVPIIVSKSTNFAQELCETSLEHDDSVFCRIYKEKKQYSWVSSFITKW